MARKDKKHPNEMSFLDHLEDLRWHLIRSSLAILIAGTIAFLAKSFIFDTLIFGPVEIDFWTYRVLCDISQWAGFDESFCLSEIPFRIQSRVMAGQFSAHIWTAITAGFIVSFPYVIYEFWKFLSPGLYEEEKKNAKWFILAGSLLFFTGVLFGYYIISPLSIRFLGSYQVSNIVFNDFDLGSYIGLLRACVLASGLIFELPILIYFLSKLGLVTPQFLKENRKYAIVLILIFSAIITPPDVASQIIVTIPVLVLYEISIFISKVVVKNQKKKEKERKTN
ncbi:MAG: twin-arginine translocase subunit TatC [Psychroflexus maritimus]